MPVDYKSWFENAKAELQRVREEKAELERALALRDQQIAALLQTMIAIAPLAGEEPPEAPAAAETETPPVGMTDAIRTILSKAREPLTAGEIRDRLEDTGFDMKSYSNPLATIHTVLRRLTESEKVDVHESSPAAAGGKKFSIVPGKGHTVGLALERVGGKFGVDLVAGKSFALGKELKGYLGVTRRRKKGVSPSV